ncbi:MAG TPA: ATP-binding cassette domain-containing protein [Propionibacterium sp.]|jgi:ABC-2 type transport system ATP-binding protein|nr:ATP-binding cassette domain-containing protein [Propionibacterium sp.]
MHVAHIPWTTENPWAVEIDGLTKRFDGWQGQRLAVDGLAMRVPRVGVHGFLGPNGSGKSTTIRMLLGLVRPSGGTMRLLGTPVPERLPDVISRVGAIVERPRFAGQFSGRKNLHLLARSIGVPSRVVEEVLELVGLRDRASDPYAKYSLGMKQRLAVASTLLKDPAVVIFDEPTNGLDPSGIREMRQMMRTLAARGKAVLVSTHLIGELEQIVDSVTIIRAGRTVIEGRLDDVLGAHHVLRVEVDDPDRAATVLRARGWSVDRRPRHLDVAGDWPGDVLNRHLGEAGIWASGIRCQRGSLEQRFLQLTDASVPQPPHPLVSGRIA